MIYNASDSIYNITFS